MKPHNVNRCRYLELRKVLQLDRCGVSTLTKDLLESFINKHDFSDITAFTELMQEMRDKQLYFDSFRTMKNLEGYLLFKYKILSVRHKERKKVSCNQKN